jgi:hypothetical protein
MAAAINDAQADRIVDEIEEREEEEENIRGEVVEKEGEEMVMVVKVEKDEENTNLNK